MQAGSVQGIILWPFVLPSVHRTLYSAPEKLSIPPPERFFRPALNYFTAIILCGAARLNRKWLPENLRSQGRQSKGSRRLKLPRQIPYRQALHTVYSPSLIVLRKKIAVGAFIVVKNLFSVIKHLLRVCFKLSCDNCCKRLCCPLSPRIYFFSQACVRTPQDVCSVL